MKRLVDEDEIRTEVDRLARRIAGDYRDRPLTILGVLTGSIIFLSDLVRRIDLPIRLGLIQASSYRGPATVPGNLSVNMELLPEISGRDVLLVDDIFDTGKTLETLIEALNAKGAAGVRCAVLLWKEERRAVELVPDYYCFKIPNVFAVGYGLDYNDEYRHLPYIAALEDGDF